MAYSFTFTLDNNNATVIKICSAVGYLCVWKYATAWILLGWTPQIDVASDQNEVRKQW